ncbi:biotin transporter BioY [Histidinibacterium lentulum]|uniref:Biotin transporter n=1 Tax=Histidinibacterium lentulum TaxID=2480588 RepID=A0A3N2R4T6_9RHOB|nr:biotin transporter BioY [Histidinibacterium lentulum]ROU02371.1 biotin transporter BioY [Histidinibacterium lentulum]
MTDRVLSEAFGPTEGTGRLAKDAALVALGIAAMVVAANIRVPMWPVPVTMQTFAVLTIGAVYGARLGVVTLLGYLVLGALGLQVFTGETAGLAYMVGPTGGYLVGFAVAAGVVGALARRGWDRSVMGMVGALLIGNAVIYAFGLPWMAWLFAAERGWDWVMQWGMVNFLPGDALKLVLAALLVPGLWRLMGAARD